MHTFKNTVRPLCAAFALAAFVVSGCGTPAFTSAMRSNFEPGIAVEAKCIRYLDRRSSEFRNKVEEMYKKGWRLAYVSEYTSTKKMKFAHTGCFERAVASNKRGASL